MGDALAQLSGVAGSVLLNQLGELLSGLGILQLVVESLGLLSAGLGVLNGGSVVGQVDVVSVLGMLGIQLHDLVANHVPGVGGGGGLLTGGGVLLGGGGGDQLGVAGLAAVTEQPLVQIGSGSSGGIGPLSGGLLDVVQLGSRGGLDVGADGVSGLLVGIGVLGGEDGLDLVAVCVLTGQVVENQDGGQHVSLGLLGAGGILNVLIGNVGLVQSLELGVNVVLHNDGLDLVSGLAGLDVVLILQVVVDQLVGGVFGGIEGSLVVVAVLLDLLGGSGVGVVLLELGSVLAGDEVVLHSRADDALGHTLADPVLEVVGEGNAVDLGGLLQTVDVLVDVGGDVSLVLVVQACVLSALAVSQVLLSVGVSGSVKALGAHGGGDHVVGVVCTGGEHLGDAVGVLHQTVLVVHELGVVLVLGDVEAVDVQLLLVELDGVALGGVVHTADDTDGVNEGVAQDGYDKHESHNQNEGDVGKIALGLGLLIHCR